MNFCRAFCGIMKGHVVVLVSVYIKNAVSC